MHGVTLLVMPALIFASGINEVALLRTCQQTYKDKSAAAQSCVHVFIKVKETSQQGGRPGDGVSLLNPGLRNVSLFIWKCRWQVSDETRVSTRW